MKRLAFSIYTLVGAAILLSSCRQDDDMPDGPGNPGDRRILFHSSLPELSTRASVLSSDLPHFFLTAFDESDSKFVQNGTLTEYFFNQKLVKPEGASNYVSDNCVWPAPGQEEDLLHFFAYYPDLPDAAKLVNQSTVSSAGNISLGYEIENYSISMDIAKQVDFISAYATGTMDANQFTGIKLEFKHQLSRIEVMAKGQSKSFKLEIAGVRFGGIPTMGTFRFQTNKLADWSVDDKRDGVAQFIYPSGESIVTIENTTDEQSILGEEVDNYAMLIPSPINSTYQAWDFANDPKNTKGGMFIGILLRVLDKTGKQQYPYFDNSQGLNAMDIPKVFFIVETSTGIIKDNPGQLYKNDGDYFFTDAEMKNPYTIPAGCTVEEFGWANVPISGTWEPGRAYTYTLDFTYGVGLHGPEITAEGSGSLYLEAGDPIISDRVGVSLGFKDWTIQTPTGIEVPGN